MIVSIGKFELKKRTLLPQFLKISKQIQQQALESKGNIKTELDNEGIACFYSFTHWQSKEDMLLFVHSGEHKKALNTMKELCKKAAFLYFESEDLVSISYAKQELKNHQNTRFIEF